MVKEIRISGSLTASDYRYLQDELLKAMKDAMVSSVLLDIDSAGGSVESLHETASLIREVARVKPVYAYTQTKMLSAAYWLASQATKVLASPTSKIGSIGALAVHFDYSQNLEKNGVKVTVLRSVEGKAVPNMYEPMTDEAKAELQASLNILHERFVSAVKDVRKTANQELWANGKSFPAEEALRLGLVDALVMPFQLKDYIHQHQTTEITMDSNIVESIKTAFKDLFEHNSQAQMQELASKLEHAQSALKSFEEKISALEKERERLLKESNELRKALREKELREFLVKSNRLHGDNLEKALEFAMKLDDANLESFKAVVLAHKEVDTGAKFTSGKTTEEDDYKKIVEEILNAK